MNSMEGCKFEMESGNFSAERWKFNENACEAGRVSSSPKIRRSTSNVRDDE